MNCAQLHTLARYRTQSLPRKLLPTRAKEIQVRRRLERQFTRLSLWPIGSSVDLKRAHNPKVAGSIPAPATIENRALEDVNPPRPFVREGFATGYCPQSENGLG